MKGIILAGGKGTRLYPTTYVTSKQLLPIFDKPMIYYPLSILMLTKIRDILIIGTPDDLPCFQKLFKDGSHLGLNISYAMQEEPKGLAEAFIIGKSFIQNDSVCLILGDNIFYGHDLPVILQKYSNHKQGGVVFAYHVKNPSQYGVITWDEKQNVTSIEEKPKYPQSSYAVCGIYFYDNSVIEIASSLQPSKRGELEITDVSKKYLQKQDLKLEILGRGYAWLDTGTFQDLQKASFFVQTIQERQGIKIACIEEIAYRMGYISQEQLLMLAKDMQNNEYGKYLCDIAGMKSPMNILQKLYDNIGCESLKGI